jgi:type II secretion system protein G
MRCHRGFTLIELLMVIAIIACLSVIALSSFSNVQDRARSSRAMSEIRILEKEITAYTTDKAVYPPTLFAFGRANAGTPDVSTLLDPWKQPYIYTLVPARTNGVDEINHDFDIYSKGPDMVSAGGSINDDEDDIIRGTDGAFVGIAKRYALGL